MQSNYNSLGQLTSKTWTTSSGTQVKNRAFGGDITGAVGGLAPKPIVPVQQQPYAPAPQPQAQQPQQAPQPVQSYPSDGGYGGQPQMSYPMMMLQQQAMPEAPVPVGGQEAAPQEVAEAPPPTIFDVGRRVTANPDLAKRNPAYEGLLRRFRSQAY